MTRRVKYIEYGYTYDTDGNITACAHPDGPSHYCSYVQTWHNGYLTSKTYAQNPKDLRSFVQTVDDHGEVVARIHGQDPTDRYSRVGQTYGGAS